MEDNISKETIVGRPKGVKGQRKDWQSLQIRCYPDVMRRFDKAMNDTPLTSRAEFGRILLDEAMKARGF